MNLDKCALIITSSVKVSAPLTELSDAAERATQYIDSISFFLSDSPIKKVIVCDNSGHEYPQSLYKLAELHGKEIELFSFYGNSGFVALYGKGYGEGEILEYVFKNSQLITGVDGFLKVTGRLKVINVAALLKNSNHGENYIMPISLVKPRFLMPKAIRYCVDTRVYYVTSEYFKDVLLTVYKDVRDYEGFFLEHAYYRAMSDSGAVVNCFSTPPEIVGMSGSKRELYRKRSFLKRWLVNFVAHLGYIKAL